VGTNRRPIVLQKGGYLFVGPDNGVFSGILSSEGATAGYRIARDIFCLSPVSRTFHGRDIFAPVAGHLARGVRPRDIGPRVRDFVRLDWSGPRPEGNKFLGEVLWADSFGNLITNFPREEFERLLIDHPSIIRGKRWRIDWLAQTYGQGPAGKPIALFGSSGLLEIAVNQGNAEKELGMKAGDKVTIVIGER
jgi:hypothetical protein